MQPGDRIGRYLLEGLLGEGGMGQVFRAYDAALNRRVAIKLLHPDAVDAVNAGGPSATARILREARMAASLDHPNVVSIFDVGEERGVAFIVMELVVGRSLRAFVGRADVPFAERVRWLVDVARALAAAHKAGLVHRDVKPENVLVREDGVVKVLDFGIARLSLTSSQRPPADFPPPPSSRAGALLHAATDATAATLDKSTLAGTPAYMAPEQIRCEVLGARVDQFAWGVVAYELLTGRLPWPPCANNASLLLAVLSDPPAPVSAAELGVPEPFVTAILRALAKAPADRFASMEALLSATGVAPLASSPDASARLQAPADIASAPTILATRSATSLSVAAKSAVESSSRRGRSRAAIAAACGAMAAIAIGVAVKQGGRAPSSPPATATPPARATPPIFTPSEPVRLTFDQGCEEYPSITPDARTVVFDTTVGDDIQIAALDLESRAQRRLTSDAGWHFAPAVSPDGKMVAFIRQHDGETATWTAPLDGSSPPRLFARGKMRPSFSPDGRALWAGAAEKPQRFDVATQTATRSLDAPSGYALLRLRELEGGRVIGRLFDLKTKRGRGLVIYGADGSAPSTLFGEDTEDAIALTPDGSRTLVPKQLPTGRVELWQVPLDGAAASLVPGNVVLPTKGLVLSKDGAKAVWSTCSTEQDIAALRGDKWPAQAQPVVPKAEWTDEQPAGVPGAPTKLVVVSDRTARRQLWVVDTSNRESPRSLPTGDLDVVAPAVSPDARWVSFAAPGRGIYVVPLDGSSPARPLTTGANDASPTFARDGATVFFETVSASKKRAVARVRTSGGAPEIVVDGGARPSASPVDDRLAYVAMDGEEGTPTVVDLATRKERALSPSLKRASYGVLRFSPDGKRVAVSIGLTEVAEVNASTGAVLRRFTSGDQITSITYVGGDVAMSRVAWRGDLWMAQVRWVGP